MKKKKAPKKGALVIDKTELMLTTAGKLGKHTPTVQSGTGVQQSKKAYDRKKEKASHRYNDVEDAFSYIRVNYNLICDKISCNTTARSFV